MVGETCTGSCLRWAKVGFVGALLVESLLCVVLGTWIGRRAKSLRAANALAAGVFLASAFVHIIPHASHLLKSESEEAHGGENKAESKKAEGEKKEAKGEEHGDEHGHEHGEEEHKEEKGAENKAEGEKHSGHDEHGHGGFPTANAVSLATILALVFVENVLLSKFGHGHDHDSTDEKEAEVEDESLPAPASSGDTKGDADSGGFFTSAFSSAASIVAAISFHSLVAAIAFGVSPDFSGALTIFIAVAAHRWIVCSAILARLTAHPGLKSLQKWILFFSFVVVLPIGAGIGLLLSGLSATVEGVFVAISAGAFVYLGMEGMFEEFVLHRQWKILKFIAFFLGAALMVTIEGILVATGNQI